MSDSDADHNINDRNTAVEVSAHFKQLLAVILILGAVVILGAVFVIQRELTQQRIARNWSVTEFGLATPHHNRLSADYLDADHNLIADCPADPATHVDPETLVFSYIAGSRTDQEAKIWEPLLASLEKATGLHVEHRVLSDIESQLLELRSHALHITALNTGTIPRAVNACGFVPMFAFSAGDGEIGISTQFIVPATSSIQSIQELKDQRITFTSENSNSGFKAPVVILNSDFGMKPGIEYQYGFSTSHEESIRLIKEDQIVVAPVASDMLERAVAADEIGEDDYRVIYQSERFPSAVFGCLYALSPELQSKIREAFARCSLEGTELADTFESIQFVRVNYKNDFALIRRIDDALGIKHEMNQKFVGSRPQQEVATPRRTLKASNEP